MLLPRRQSRTTPQVAGPQRVADTTTPILNAVGRIGQSITRAGIDQENRQLKLDQFKADSDFFKLKDQIDDSYKEGFNNLQPGASGFAQQQLASFDNTSKAFIDTVPEHLRPQFQEKLDRARIGFENGAVDDEEKERGRFFREGINDNLDQLRFDIERNPDSTNTVIGSGKALIDSADLPEIEKDQLKKAWEDSAREQGLLTKVSRDDDLARRLTRRGPTGNIKLSGNRGTVAQVLQSKGLNDIQIAGVVGNLMAESGRELDVNAVGDDGTAFGIAQWRFDRVDSLKRFARTKGTDWRDVATQAEFIFHELRTSEGRAWQALQNAKTVEEATAAFVHFERPQGYKPNSPRNAHNYKGRLANAKKVLGGNLKNLEGQVDDNVGINELPAGTDFDTFVRVQKQARATVQQNDRQLANEVKAQMDAQTAEYNSALDDLKLSILDGNSGQAEIDQFRDNFDPGFRDVDSLQTELKQANKSREDGRLATEAFADPDRVFDFSDSADKKLINTTFDQIIKAGGEEGLANDEVAKTAIALARRANAIPKGFEGQVKSLIDQRDPALVRRGFDLMDRLYNQNPQVAIRDLSKGTVERLQNYKSLQGFLSDEELAKSISPAGDIVNQQRQDVLSKEAEKVTKDITVDELLNDLDDSILPFTEPDAPADPVAQSRLLMDYKNLYTDRFVKTNNPEQSKADALELLKSRWGSSSANGGRLMRNPPERHYPAVNGSHDWVNEQLTREVMPLVDEGSELSIVTTRQTEADIAAGRRPRYRVLAEDENGLFQPVFDEQGREAFISFDPAKAEEKARKEGRKEFSRQRLLREAIENSPLNQGIVR